MNNDQVKILKAIEELSEELGYSPSIREIDERAGINKPGSTAFQINRLAAMGLVTFKPYTARTIRLVKNGGDQDDRSNSGASD